MQSNNLAPGCWLLATGTVAGLLFVAMPARAQGTVPDYVQAITLRDRFQALAVNVPEQVQWIRNTNRFWYRKTVPGGNAFVLVNADTQTKEPAFDHAKLADALAAAMKGKYTPVTLPFTTFNFVDDDRAIEFSPTGRRRWPRELLGRCGAARSIRIRAKSLKRPGAVDAAVA